MTRPRLQRFRHERGNELVEFALVLPLLVLMLAGAVEFGRAFYTYNILTKSLRNATRYLSASQISRDGAIDAGYVASAQKLAVYGNVSGEGTKIIPDLDVGHISVPEVATPGPSVGQFYITVTASYPYSPLFGFVLSDVTFRPEVTMLFVGYVSGR